ANLDNVLAGAREEDLQAAAASLLTAEADVRLKQADYDARVFGEPQVAEPLGVALQTATLAYESAQANYNKLLNGASPEEIAISEAQLNEARAGLATVLAGATPEQIAQSQASVAQAEAALAQTLAGATDEDIAIAEAGVNSARASVASAENGVETARLTVAEAEASLESAQVQLAKTQLVAPFDGTISSLNVDLGEVAAAGSPAVVLGDTSKWQIETDDLTEIDVVRVKEGAKVSISVDALPDETFEGEVVRVKPQSETKAGDVTYTVLIEITEGDVSKLRWGMTTFVDIDANPDL
ncbi:MAG: HlyD family efflux transporter periplasmic adaptor subunit, partial [Chloroflexota bacterium]